MMKVVKVFSKDHRITLSEVIKLLGVDQQTFDYALPQNWVDDMVARVGDPRGHFVWLYEKGSCFGVPRPVTHEGMHQLMRYNLSKGTQYSVDYDMVRFE